MAEWSRARKTAVTEYREATPEDEEMIRRREGPAILAEFGIGPTESAWPHHLIMRGCMGEEWPIHKEAFERTYETLEA